MFLERSILAVSLQSDDGFQLSSDYNKGAYERVARQLIDRLPVHNAEVDRESFANQWEEESGDVEMANPLDNVQNALHDVSPKFDQLPTAPAVYAVPPVPPTQQVQRERSLTSQEKDEMTAWLKNLRIEKHAEALMEQGFDLEQLQEMDKEEHKEAGLPLAAVMKILKARK